MLVGSGLKSPLKIDFYKIHKIPGIHPRPPKYKNKIIREFQNPGNKIFEPFHGK